MPRDLLADKRTLDAMPELSREPEHVSSPKPNESSSLVPHRSSNIASEERLKQMGVQPFAQLLNVEDLDDCDWLEHAAFDPTEAASREKVRSTTSFYLNSPGPLPVFLHPVRPLGSVRHREMCSSPPPLLPRSASLHTIRLICRLSSFKFHLHTSPKHAPTIPRPHAQNGPKVALLGQY
jgi:hypothetical protein